MSFQIPDCFYRVSVKALIMEGKDRFLLVKEENGLWELPGGGLDFGESPHSGIAREIMEEMGLLTVFIAEQPRYFYPAKNPKDQFIVNAVYETRVAHLDFQPSPECMEIRFFTVDEVLENRNQMYPNILEFVKYFK